MPYKHTIKDYQDGAVYHVYNQGLDKKGVFSKIEDSTTFRNYLIEYLSPPPDMEALKREFTLNGRTFTGVPRQPKNFHGQLELLAYCLMPNAYHFLIRPHVATTLPQLMRALSTRYSMYYNKTHERIGPVFRSRYKAAIIDSDSNQAHASRFIHRLPLPTTQNLAEWYSSAGNYFGVRHEEWVSPGVCLEAFYRAYPNTDYQAWVYDPNVDSLGALGDLVLAS